MLGTECDSLSATHSPTRLVPDLSSLRQLDFLCFVMLEASQHVKNQNDIMHKISPNIWCAWPHVVHKLPPVVQRASPLVMCKSKSEPGDARHRTVDIARTACKVDKGTSEFRLRHCSKTNTTSILFLQSRSLVWAKALGFRSLFKMCSITFSAVLQAGVSPTNKHVSKVFATFDSLFSSCISE